MASVFGEVFGAATGGGGGGDATLAKQNEILQDLADLQKFVIQAGSIVVEMKTTELEVELT